MSFYNGKISVSFFGESHSSHIGLTIHNFPHGKKLNIDRINEDLQLRHSFVNGKSTRTEADQFEIISGYFNGYTTGAPLTFIIKNNDIRSSDYEKNAGIIRPSHGDYALFKKFEGFHDYRGGGHYSGRLTSLFIILGSICKTELEKKNIKIYSRIKSISDIEDNSLFNGDNLDLSFPVVSSDIKENMINFIDNLKDNSTGGVIETKIENLPIGLGDPIFSGVESVISSLVFSIPGVKGIEFGAGFAISKMLGSKANDQMEILNDKVQFLSNNSGGISSGITNGEEVIFRTAIKPTPTIGLPQKTINILKNENITTVYGGRHDKCIVPKVVHVINAVTYFAVYLLMVCEGA